MNPRSITLLCLVALVLTLPLAVGQFYADVTFTVGEDGWTTVSGTTNHPELDINATQEWTTQQGRYWVLNVTAPGHFSNFIYRLEFPPNTDINYINTPAITRIQHTGDKLAIIGTGENSSLYITTQYTIRRTESGSGPWQIPVYGIGGAVLILAGIYHWWPRRRGPSRRRMLATLSERQRLIYRTLEKHKKPMTQGDIQQRTQLPKASLSRNIDALVGRGLVKREVRGMSNVIYLNDDVSARSGELRQQ